MPATVQPKLPPGFSTEVARPLLEAAQSVASVKPWEFMSDLEFLGLRDEMTGELHVASILGMLGTVFAVVIYRHEAGLRWIHSIAKSRTAPGPYAALEDNDYLKVEWTAKSELQKPDLATLKAAGFAPKSRGSVWPKFESSRPGWHPWFASEDEARLLTQHLRKVAAFARMRERVGIVHVEPIEARVPIIPAGDDFPLEPGDLEWVPFISTPAPKPEPMTLSEQEQARLGRLPMRKDWVVEAIAPLVPEFSFIPESVNQPVFGRVAMILDRRTGELIGSCISHGADPLRDGVSTAFMDLLNKASVRPGLIEVDNERLLAVLSPVCKAIGVTVRMNRQLDAAYNALAEMEALSASMLAGQM